MAMTEELSKDFLEDWDWCLYCGEDTWHVVGESGPECEYCLLSEY